MNPKRKGQNLYCCDECQWKGTPKADKVSILFLRGYLVLALLAALGNSYGDWDLPNKLSWPICLGILIGLPLVPFLLGRRRTCSQCGSRKVRPMISEAL